ncbi:hypothetical protein D3C86_1636820 [compost metagenome]
MHAAIVFLGDDEFAHVIRLRVLAQQRVVIGRTRMGHRAQAPAVDPGGEQVRPDQPVRLFDSVAEDVLLGEDAEHIRQ